MPRRKISEGAAKKIIAKRLGMSYEGWEVRYQSLKKDIAKVGKKGTLVAKVDQAVKGRFKNGLVALDVKRSDVVTKIEAMHRKGFDYFLVEPYFDHASEEERYLSLSRTKNGLELCVSNAGGVDIEGSPESIESYVLGGAADWQEVSQRTGWSEKQLLLLVETFNENHFTFLEINPYILEKGVPRLLDLAIEVDDAAGMLVNDWAADDIRTAPRKLSREEHLVSVLGESSSASFSFQVINPDGSIFVLLSGGGASVTVCDEIYSAGYGKSLANYGEYSGNPTTEETYIYTSAVLRSLLKSKAHRKTLFIGGAVANFTDISKTFDGVTQAIEEYGKRLQTQDVRVVVRRGGPNQEVGLGNIRKALDRYNLTADIYDQSTSIDVAVKRLLKEAA